MITGDYHPLTMVLYIDETESADEFIVAGLLVSTEQDIVATKKHFLKDISGIPLSDRVKAKIYTEFKSTLLDKNFQRIKIKMLDEIASIGPVIIYSCFSKKIGTFSQADKETAYLILLSQIVDDVQDEICIVFDAFNIKSFDEQIVATMKKISFVKDVIPVDSQKNFGIQLADNICSTIRLHRTNLDDSNFFEIIERFIRCLTD